MAASPLITSASTPICSMESGACLPSRLCSPLVWKPPAVASIASLYLSIRDWYLILSDCACLSSALASTPFAASAYLSKMSLNTASRWKTCASRRVPLRYALQIV